jgi:hypothetical protein
MTPPSPSTPPSTPTDEAINPFSVDAYGVPLAFTTAVTEFAELTNLDAQALLRGDSLQIKGFSFWLQHYGEHDPAGLTLFVDLGTAQDLTPEQEIPVLRQLLENNASSPAGLCGFFARLPDGGQIVYGFRLALDRLANGGEAVAQMLLSLVSATQLMRETLIQSVDILQQNAAQFSTKP